MPEASRSLGLRLALVVGLPIASAALAVASTHAVEPGDPRASGPPEAVEEREPPSPNAIRIAGTGSALPLVRVLARRFEEHEPGSHVHVHDSIGTSGGLWATADGAVDLGLAARPLKDSESRLGILAFPLARTPIVLAANHAVPDRNISLSRLGSLIAGAPTRWQDGHRAIFLQRERGDSGLSVLNRVMPTLGDAVQRSRETGRWRVLHHDDAMEEALLETQGAVGFHDLGSIRIQGLDLSWVLIDGQDPTSASYPYLKELFILSRGQPKGLARRFVEFVRTEENRLVATRAGYWP